jgi:hypothetical protein
MYKAGTGTNLAQTLVISLTLVAKEDCASQEAKNVSLQI